MHDFDPEHEFCCCSRREFMEVLGAAGGASLIGAAEAKAAAAPAPAEKSPAVVRAIFLYPPSESLRQAGYWSWPGVSFDAEGHHRQYLARLKAIEAKLGMRIEAAASPVSDAAGVDAFLREIEQNKPDAVLVIPFYKGHWPLVLRILDQAKLPTVVFATWAVLFVAHLRQIHDRPGVHAINSPDNFEALEYAMKMVAAARWMRGARLISITGKTLIEAREPHLGTLVRTIPHARFAAEVDATPDAAARPVAEAYRRGAKEIVEPTEADLLDAAKGYLALKRILAAERGDAVMVRCLEGLRRPPGGKPAHVPLCMGFMSLRDEGIAAGCQADLESTLMLMLLQRLFDRPGFQHNLGLDTERNQYFGAHCTSASRMGGPSAPAEPYVLRSHNEAGWGCVPRVLMTPGQEVTLAQYVAGPKPKMHVYTGKIVRVPPPCGCRTNVVTTVNELPDVCQMQSNPMGHMCLVYGDFGRQLRAFCRLLAIDVAT